MSDNRLQNLNEIEVLLASRQRVSQWLEKLHAAGSKTPPSVRQRVERDYQGRLAQVVDQLRSHSEFITTSLHGLRAQADQLEQQRAEEQETLAEAELRHVVGEYSDGEWSQVEGEGSLKIGGLDGEIERLTAEIGRLEEVLSLVAVPLTPVVVSEANELVPDFADALDTDLGLPQQPPLALVADDIPELKPELVEPPAAVQSPHPMEIPEAPRFVPRPSEKLRPSGPARTVSFAPPPVPALPPAPSQGQQQAPMDELTFLKSMSLDRNPGQGSTVATPRDVKTDRPAQTAPKTLKCGECGALNRPTEWYCERCGAELAAV